MSVPMWVGELARQFWEMAGQALMPTRASRVMPWPRPLRQALAVAPFDLTVKGCARLSVRKVECYLAGQGIDLGGRLPDRHLRGCLVARCGQGWVFVDADDPPQEQTASLAHEVAHFLRHHWQPRHRAVAALGAGILEVLDGRRLARPAERLHALLRGVSTRTYTHLMDREGKALAPDVATAEREADLLACELLAPAAEVLARLRVEVCLHVERVATVLREEFGLPGAMAAEYAERLCPPPSNSGFILRLKQGAPGRWDRECQRPGDGSPRE